MKLKLVLLAGLFAFGYAMSTTAGTVDDTDGDGVPDSFDNCSTIANGPGEASNQNDEDQDGFGTRCDADYNQNGAVEGSDFTIFVTNFNTAAALQDHNGNGVVEGSDFTLFVQLFNAVPGPSGLSCADPTIDVGAGDMPCTP